MGIRVAPRRGSGAMRRRQLQMVVVKRRREDRPGASVMTRHPERRSPLVALVEGLNEKEPLE